MKRRERESERDTHAPAAVAGGRSRVVIASSSVATRARSIVQISSRTSAHAGTGLKAEEGAERKRAERKRAGGRADGQVWPGIEGRKWKGGGREIMGVKSWHTCIQGR